MIICFNQYNDPKSQLYGCYVHDCIIGPSSTREEINQFITAVNSLHSSLKYTYIHTLFATPKRGFSVTKGIKKIKLQSIKMNKRNGKGV